MFLFCGLAWLHAFEALYAASLCRAAGLAAPDAARCAAAVLLAGAFALARVPTPTGPTPAPAPGPAPVILPRLERRKGEERDK